MSISSSRIHQSRGAAQGYFTRMASLAQGLKLKKFISMQDEPPEYGKIRVNPIEKEKQKQENDFEPVPEAPANTFLAAALFKIKNFLKEIFPWEEAPLKFSSYQEVTGHIQQFRTLLQRLAQKDCSHDPEFAEELSTTWHTLIDAVNHLAFEKTEDPLPLMQLKFFLSTLSHFPPGEEHPLSFYFNAYAGKEWIPFPFMKMLQGLHEEKTTLQKWISLLSDIAP